jgi:Ca2+-binding RTX toxin-like protein
VILGDASDAAAYLRSQDGHLFIEGQAVSADALAQILAENGFPLS